MRAQGCHWHYGTAQEPAALPVCHRRPLTRGSLKGSPLSEEHTSGGNGGLFANLCLVPLGTHLNYRVVYLPYAPPWSGSPYSVSPTMDPVIPATGSVLSAETGSHASWGKNKLKTNHPT